MKKLLLVDDDIALRKQFCFALQRDYKVYEASNPKEAFEIIKSVNLDIALVDLGLPPYENSHKGGRAVVLALMEKSDAKVIILTGQESREYAKELISIGVFDYLLKPIDIPALIFSLKRAS
ncbi:MAG: response regulator, partial [Campylobacterota bacterium]